MVALGARYAGPGELRFVSTGAKMSAAAYLELVENTYVADAQELTPAGNVRIREDNAPAHQAEEEWPATSPGLNVLDFYVWGRLQHVVGRRQCGWRPTDLASLKTAARKAARELPLDGIRSAIDGFYKRARLCVEAEGRAFKHMMSRKV